MNIKRYGYIFSAAAVLFFSFSAISAKADNPGYDIVYSGTCGDNLKWEFDYDENGSGILTIFGSGDMYNYSYSSLPEWNSDAPEIKAVIVEDGVTSIGDYAFCGGYYIVEDFNIADSVTKIGKAAFAFESMADFVSVNIPENALDVESGAFSSSNLSTAGPEGSGCSIEYSWSSYIPRYAFNSSSIKKIIISSDISKIYDSSFSSCYELVSVVVEDGNSVYSSEDGVLYNK
ncbi:MAG: leucine-rich repeat domain-containing protein [Clostridiales bacterium]|nr:leucine-rich repeat domain-containing protein [Clostridiales bacterium]